MVKICHSLVALRYISFVLLTSTLMISISLKKKKKRKKKKKKDNSCFIRHGLNRLSYILRTCMRELINLHGQFTAFFFIKKNKNKNKNYQIIYNILLDFRFW
jgi:ribosomal protein S14